MLNKLFMTVKNKKRIIKVLMYLVFISIITVPYLDWNNRYIGSGIIHCERVIIKDGKIIYKNEK